MELEPEMYTNMSKSTVASTSAFTTSNANTFEASVRSESGPVKVCQ